MPNVKREFWDMWKLEPGFAGRPMPDLDDDLIPLKFHADEGRFSAGRQIMIMQFSSYQHYKDPLDSKYLLCVIPASLYHKQELSTIR